MTGRDRMVLLVLGVAGVLAVFWFAALSPRRGEARDLETQAQTLRAERDVAVQTATAARAAQDTTEADQAVIARLGKAIPADDDTASLLYQLQAAAGRAKVDLRSLRLTGGAGTAAGSAAAPAPAVPGAQAGPLGLATLPFALTFEGRFSELRRFLARMHGFTTVDGEAIRVGGRLVAVDAVSLGPTAAGLPHIKAVITASAYLAPVPSPPAPAAAPAQSGTPAPGGSAQTGTGGGPAAPTTAVVTGGLP